MAHHFRLIFVVVVIVERFLFDDIQLNGIEANDFKLDPAFLTIDNLAFIHVGIHVDIGIAFRTRSGRHFFYLQGRFRLPAWLGTLLEIRLFRFTPLSI
jgi:hypothetical protein